MGTIRDALLRRKAWFLAVSACSWFTMVLVLPVALHMRIFAGGAKVVIAIVVSLGALLAVFLSSHWIRCPRCLYNLTRLSLRRKDELQVNVCAHCGLVFDAPVETAGSR